MLIPIKCFTCGKVLADLSEYYKKKVLEQKLQKLKSTEDLENTEYFTNQNVDKEEEALQEEVNEDKFEEVEEEKEEKEEK